MRKLTSFLTVSIDSFLVEEAVETIRNLEESRRGAANGQSFCPTTIDSNHFRVACTSLDSERIDKDLYLRFPFSW